MTMRIGQGFDVHALVPGRRLVIGGVEIAHDKGLLGHSDADVLIHAICDAMLGAAALGDIGRHFPDSDPRYQGIDSRELLRHCANLLRSLGLRVVNVDATIIAEAPRMAPHIPKMVANIADDLAIEPHYVNVKATTTEGLGFTGQGEGIAAPARERRGGVADFVGVAQFHDGGPVPRSCGTCRHGGGGSPHRALAVYPRPAEATSVTRGFDTPSSRVFNRGVGCASHSGSPEGPSGIHNDRSLPPQGQRRSP